MMWNSKCRKFRIDLALLAGNDLEGAARLAAERHAVTCPECRDYWQSLSSSQQLLERVRAEEVQRVQEITSGEDSVWSDVCRQIRVIDERHQFGTWRGWLPTGALAAACLAVVVISSDLLQETPSAQTSINSQRFVSPTTNQPVVEFKGASTTTVIPAPRENSPLSHDRDERPLRFRALPHDRLHHDGVLRGF